MFYGLMSRNFGHTFWLYICHKANIAFHNKNIMPTDKHGGGSEMVWGCFAASVPG